eukprot:CAMPEP_0185018774 /NCGR_PEP_ID=MMETSP1103-20130426/1444_1 /TAXON_ID=36769 /ORGANISM="Paraphysomonas bandaiensis, Strain Caron Lab Isolate" /LENGTH=178 /DNA_ID=CAMNT_0027548745 /DNA_START=68 /DNA_END=604 /DNA_ORIENTATION=-
MSITVAQEGNRRRGKMTTDEVEQCLVDIKSWFERKSDVEFGTPARGADFQRLQKALDGADIPEGLTMLLSCINGSMWFMDKEAMSVEKIIETVNFLNSNSSWEAHYIPFCGDEDSLLLIDSISGKVYEWDSADGLGDCVAVSFSGYLENYRNSLLEGHMDFVSGMGVVECMTGKSSRK